MRVSFAILALSLSLAAPAQISTNSHRVAWVDQDGRVSVTNAMATQADMAAQSAAVEIALAKQQANATGYAAATQLLTEVANSISAGSPVVYYSLELVSFEAAAVFDEATSNVRIFGYEVTGETGAKTVGGTSYPCVKTVISFIFHSTDGGTLDLQGVKPLVPYNETLDGTPSSEWDFLDDALVGTPVAHSDTVTVDGRSYANYYTMDVWLPAARTNGFMKVRVPNDAAAGDGNTMDTPGDAGGWNGTLTFGTNVLDVVNGRIMAPAGGD